MVAKLKSTSAPARKRMVKKTSPNIGVKRSPATKSVIVRVTVPRAPAGRPGTKRKVAPKRKRAPARRPGTKRKAAPVRRPPPKPPGRSALPRLITVGANRGTVAPPRLRVSRTGGLVGSRVRARVPRGGMREVN